MAAAGYTAEGRLADASRCSHVGANVRARPPAPARCCLRAKAVAATPRPGDRGAGVGVCPGSPGVIGVETALGRDSPDEPRTDVDGSDFLGSREAEHRGPRGSGRSRSFRVVFEGLIWEYSRAFGHTPPVGCP